MYRVDIFLPPTRIILVIDLSLSRIVASISSLWQSLLILDIGKGQCHQALLFLHYISLSSHSLERVRFPFARLVMTWS